MVTIEGKKEKNITENTHNDNLEQMIKSSWLKIAPSWNITDMVAVNPISGFEDLTFEEGLKQAQAYFQQPDLPKGMCDVNRQSIKWLQAFFDTEQAIISMPKRELGLLKSFLTLVKFDKQVHNNNSEKKQWLEQLPTDPKKIITVSFDYLNIAIDEQELFLTLMLTTLAGWASYAQYYINWMDSKERLYPVTEAEYLAFRMVLVCLLWPEAKELLTEHAEIVKKVNVANVYAQISTREIKYQQELFKQIMFLDPPTQSTRTQAQLVFCIDVRSEPFRRAIEAQGNYNTYGFAGFFGVPVSVENSITGEQHAACPVLLKPSHHVVEYSNCARKTCKTRYKRFQGITKLYQSLKYTFIAPFSLVETIGLFSGIWMGFRSLFPNIATKLKLMIKHSIISNYRLMPDISTISDEDRIKYAESMLRVMGLTENFAPLVVLCGHRSTTQNNAYSAALDCGACGGHQGAPNARIMATILNNHDVRKVLQERKINIPEDTIFLAAEHDTTTDGVEIFEGDIPQYFITKINSLKKDLEKAKETNNLWRAKNMGISGSKNYIRKATESRSRDWAQSRPEWGLAKNAAFIIGPRWLTKDVDLQGRSFLHSYEWETDKDHKLLTTILTAPMVVAQWINSQYLFSTLDNVAFGGGSKMTKNITGKSGIVQGNASDLMGGLSFQSVYKSDKEAYHEIIRLTVAVYAPRAYLDSIIPEHQILQKLFGNSWVHLVCIDPEAKDKFQLTRELKWQKLD